MTSILITGGSGFIGRYLSAHLRALGHQVTGTTMHDVDTLYRVDLRDPEQVLRLVDAVAPDVVIHLAALSSVTEGKTLDYYATNLAGTEHLLQALDKRGRRTRLIYVSTAGVYGNQPVPVLSEDLAPQPVSHYGISKFACERIVLNAQTRHDITIARPFNVVGAGQNNNFIMPKLVRHFASKAASIRLGNLDPVRDYIDVQACCDIFAQLIGEPKSYGEIVNLCSGRGTSVRELLAMLRNASGHDIEVIAAPEFFRANEVFSLLGSTTKLDQLVPHRTPVQPLPQVVEAMLAADIARLQSGKLS